MFCEHCGENVSDVAKFCSHCGKQSMMRNSVPNRASTQAKSTTIQIEPQFQQRNIFTFFVQHPDHSPIGGMIDLVCSKHEMTFIRSEPQAKGSQSVNAVIAFGGVAGAVLGGVATVLLEKYREVSARRTVDGEFLNALVDNGVALSAIYKDVKCEIQEEKRSIFDVVGFEDKTSWVTFSGIFRFTSEQIRGSISMKFNGSASKAKTAIEAAIPIAITVIEEKLSFEKLAMVWEVSVLGPNARQERIQRRNAQKSNS